MKFDRGIRSSALWYKALIVLALLAVAPAATAGDDPNQCDAPGDSPDVIVGSIHQISNYSSIGSIDAFSIGTTSCNVGTCWLNWFSGGSNQHPTIGQNMFRLKDGRFEHIGQSWLKHGFFALSGNLCSGGGCIATSGTHLGVNCSDPYSSFLNGQQSGMGPKFEVNTATGFHPHPVTDLNLTGNSLYKRLQVHRDDLDPALNPGAQYFVEAQYIAEDDAAAGNSANNNSYRRISITGSNGSYNASLNGSTEREKPGIRAWSDSDPTVQEASFDVPDDGIFIVAYQATDLGAGQWHYEYAVQNMTSHRSARSFSIEVPQTATLSNIEFHDVDYHSGEPYDNTDWTHNGGAGGVLTWTNGTTFDDNPDANALRWGTLYNFRFDADREPGLNAMTLELFRPGTPDSVGKFIAGPALCDNSSTCDLGESPCNCAADCGPPTLTEGECGDGIDNDCDTFVDCADPECCLVGTCTSPDNDLDNVVSCEDCDDTNGNAWEAPSEAINVLAAQSAGVTTYSWDPPQDPGATEVTYEVLRARFADSFVNFTTCKTPAVPGDTTLDEGLEPNPGDGFYYLVRPLNACPSGSGDGSLGSGTAGERNGRTCP